MLLEHDNNNYHAGAADTNTLTEWSSIGAGDDNSTSGDSSSSNTFSSNSFTFDEVAYIDRFVHKYLDAGPMSVDSPEYSSDYDEDEEEESAEDDWCDPDEVSKLTDDHATNNKEGKAAYPSDKVSHMSSLTSADINPYRRSQGSKGLNKQKQLNGTSKKKRSSSSHRSQRHHRYHHHIESQLLCGTTKRQRRQIRKVAGTAVRAPQELCSPLPLSCRNMDLNASVLSAGTDPRAEWSIVDIASEKELYKKHKKEIQQKERQSYYDYAQPPQAAKKQQAESAVNPWAKGFREEEPISALQPDDETDEDEVEITFDNSTPKNASKEKSPSYHGLFEGLFLWEVKPPEPEEEEKELKENHVTQGPHSRPSKEHNVKRRSRSRSPTVEQESRRPVIDMPKAAAPEVQENEIEPESQRTLDVPSGKHAGAAAFNRHVPNSTQTMALRREDHRHRRRGLGPPPITPPRIGSKSPRAIKKKRKLRLMALATSRRANRDKKQNTEIIKNEKLQPVSEEESAKLANVTVGAVHAEPNSELGENSQSHVLTSVPIHPISPWRRKGRGRSVPRKGRTPKSRIGKKSPRNFTLSPKKSVHDMKNFFHDKIRNVIGEQAGDDIEEIEIIRDDDGDGRLGDEEIGLTKDKSVSIEDPIKVTSFASLYDDEGKKVVPNAGSLSSCSGVTPPPPPLDEEENVPEKDLTLSHTAVSKSPSAAESKTLVPIKLNERCRSVQPFGNKVLGLVEPFKMLGRSRSAHASATTKPDADSPPEDAIGKQDAPNDTYLDYSNEQSFKDENEKEEMETHNAVLKNGFRLFRSRTTPTTMRVETQVNEEESGAAQVEAVNYGRITTTKRRLRGFGVSNPTPERAHSFILRRTNLMLARQRSDSTELHNKACQVESSGSEEGNIAVTGLKDDNACNGPKQNSMTQLPSTDSNSIIDSTSSHSAIKSIKNLKSRSNITAEGKTTEADAVDGRESTHTDKGFPESHTGMQIQQVSAQDIAKKFLAANHSTLDFFSGDQEHSSDLSLALYPMLDFNPCNDVLVFPSDLEEATFGVLSLLNKSVVDVKACPDGGKPPCANTDPDLSAGIEAVLSESSKTNRFSFLKRDIFGHKRTSLREDLTILPAVDEASNEEALCSISTAEGEPHVNKEQNEGLALTGLQSSSASSEQEKAIGEDNQIITELDAQVKSESLELEDGTEENLEAKDVCSDENLGSKEEASVAQKDSLLSLDTASIVLKPITQVTVNESREAFQSASLGSGICNDSKSEKSGSSRRSASSRKSETSKHSRTSETSRQSESSRMSDRSQLSGLFRRNMQKETIKSKHVKFRVFNNPFHKTTTKRPVDQPYKSILKEGRLKSGRCDGSHTTTTASSKENKISIATPKTSNRVGFQEEPTTIVPVKKPNLKLAVNPLFQQQKRQLDGHKTGIQGRLNRLANRTSRSRTRLKLRMDSLIEAQKRQNDVNEEQGTPVKEVRTPKGSLFRQLDAQQNRRQVLKDKLSKRREFNKKVLKAIQKKQKQRARQSNQTFLENFLDTVSCYSPADGSEAEESPDDVSVGETSTFNNMTRGLSMFVSDVVELFSCEAPKTSRRRL